MSFGAQSSGSSSQGFQSGTSQGESASNSTFGTDSLSSSSGSSGSQSTGTSRGQSSGFGFSGLNPTDSAGLSGALTNQITNQVFPALTAASNANMTLPTLDENGLFPQQEAAAKKATSDALTAISGSLANKGQLQPDNVNNVAGQAVQNVLPSLFPTISQNIQTVAGAPLTTAQTRAQSVAALLQAFPGLLGSQNTQQSTQASDQQSTSFSQQLADAITRTFGQSLSHSLQSAASQGNQASNSSDFGFGLGLR